MKKIILTTLTAGMLSLSTIASANLTFIPSHEDQFRQTKKCEGCDLSGLTLYSYYGDGNSDFSGSKLKGAILNNMKATSVKFNSSDFTNTKLINAQLDNISAAECKFDNANLQNVNLYSAMLSGSSFKSANLTNARLSNATLTSSDFTGANFTGTELSGADFTNSKVTCEQLRASSQHANMILPDDLSCDLAS